MGRTAHVEGIVLARSFDVCAIQCPLLFLLFLFFFLLIAVQSWQLNTHKNGYCWEPSDCLVT